MELPNKQETIRIVFVVLSLIAAATIFLLTVSAAVAVIL